MDGIPALLSELIKLTASMMNDSRESKVYNRRAYEILDRWQGTGFPVTNIMAASDFKIVRPITITDAMITSHSVTEAADATEGRAALRSRLARDLHGHDHGKRCCNGHAWRLYRAGEHYRGRSHHGRRHQLGADQLHKRLENG